MLPYKTIIPLNKKLEMPVYLQITKAIIQQIKDGRLVSAAKLPGSRKMAELLNVHRKTVVAAYEELDAQGWIDILPSKGTFVAKKIPKIKARPLKEKIIYEEQTIADTTGFKIKVDKNYLAPLSKNDRSIQLDDGFPDTRLAPLEGLSRHYKSILNSKYSRRYLSYTSSVKGNVELRKAIVNYLQNTRGIQAGIDQVLITRGSIMGFYLLFHTIVEPGEKVIVGETNYRTANYLVEKVKGKLLYAPVDEDGIDVDYIEMLCRQQKIRAVYIASHHHHPTTVTLSAERRMKLLMLASQYHFAIIEDDYDYDFHYNSSPILPLASSDREGFVAYVGSLSKTIAPAFRVGFVVAPQNLIEELSRNRRYIDRQGDEVLERAIAHLFEEGEIKRHLRKSLKTYHQRRDFFCKLLKEELGDVINFDIPEGGMAVWARFDPKLNLDLLAEKAIQNGLFFSAAHRYNPPNKNLNATRLGFASNNETELTRAIELLKRIVKS